MDQTSLGGRAHVAYAEHGPESSYTCPDCGKTVKATSTKTVYDGERMIGIVDDFTHICVEGRELHPFAIVPFADAQDDLWRTLREKLDLRPAE